jgi:purine-binding chemotaxis protein CheW
MQFCTFYLGKDLFGVDVLEVQEVVRQHEMTQVPLAPRVVRGLINLRGNIVSTIDMRRLLNMQPLDDESQSINVITRVSSGLVSLLVDHIGDVIEAPDDRFEPVPSVLGDEIRQIITKVCKLPGNLLMILNPNRIVEFDRAKIPAPGEAHEIARN